MVFLGTLSRLGLLAALGYLGFYVYGLIMGVFSPFELLGFTMVAIGCATAFLAYILRLRHAMQTPGKHEVLMRQAHVYRERRGF
jgi:hypothetical protein